MYLTSQKYLWSCCLSFIINPASWRNKQHLGTLVKQSFLTMINAIKQLHSFGPRSVSVMNNLKSNLATLVQHKDFTAQESWNDTMWTQLCHFGPLILQFQTDHMGIVISYEASRAPAAVWCHSLVTIQKHDCDLLDRIDWDCLLDELDIHLCWTQIKTFHSACVHYRMVCFLKPFILHVSAGHDSKIFHSCYHWVCCQEDPPLQKHLAWITPSICTVSLCMQAHL